jgi:hypothetical protein
VILTPMNNEGYWESPEGFPQAFSHLALINAALNLDFQLDHGRGREIAWDWRSRVTTAKSAR